MQVTNEPSPSVNESDDQTDSIALWPLSYRLHTLQQPTAVPWWSYRLYQTLAGDKVQVLYSKDKAQSEEIAQKFLDEPVVGFDMEWPCFVRNSDNPPLQRRIGLIQVASETTIALFHIGLHPGKTTDDIIAPSLKKLIESPTIAKTGVGILGADFARLRRYFGLKPQGAFELSHLDRLVKFANGPYDLLNTKMVALAHLVEGHLGLPLEKGSVRTSNWSKPLSDEQKNYAASDAYAGFMLFHCMNAKRLALSPVPGLPLFADQYPRKPKNAKGFAPLTTLMIHSTEEGGAAIAAIDFFVQNKDEPDAQEDGSEEADAPADSPMVEEKKKSVKPKAAVTRESLSNVRRILYDELIQRRKVLAQANGLPAYVVANNTVLHGLAQQLPQNDKELLKVKGVGNVSVAKYGADWLEVIAQHIAIYGIESPVDEVSNLSTEVQQDLPSTPTRDSRRRRISKPQSSDSSPAFDPPLQRTPALHTGLSFTLAETNLGVNDREDTSPSLMGRPGAYSKYEGIEMLDLTGDTPPPMSRNTRPKIIVGQDDRRVTHTNGASRQSPDSSATSEDSSAFDTFHTPPSRSSSSLKRKRAEVTLGTSTPNRSQTQHPSFELVQEEEQVRYPQLPDTQPAPLSPKSKIFRNKLLAFSKLVTRRLSTNSSGSWVPPSTPIVSESTLDLIVAISPTTLEELNRVPGIETFAQACRDVQMDLLRNIIKFTPTRP